MILDVSGQNSIFDEYGFVRGVPFVVHVERATPRWNGPIVDDRAEIRGHALAYSPAEGRNALPVEVRFEPMADSFVKQNPRPARPEHDFHFARRGLHGAELDH